MPQSWFERLFKFNQLNFSEGELGFLQGNQQVLLWVLVALGLATLFAVIYFTTNAFTSNKTRATSLSLRITALALLILPLLEPVLIMPDVIPDDNFVAVVVDASESMQIADEAAGLTRLDRANALLFDEADGLVAALDDVFNVRYYTFDGQTQRVDSVQNVGADGEATNISQALDRVISDFNGIPLSGVVLLTDGGDNSTEVPLNQAEQLRAMNVPMHVVGMGQESFAQEREILEASAGRSVEETTGAEIEVKVRSWDEAPAPVTFGLFLGDERVFSATKTIKGGGKIDQFTFFFEPESQRADAYVLKIDEAENELNTENNAVSVLIDTRKDTLGVLLLEGSLRPEFKFLKRALEDDQVIDVASVSRTGPSQFYRQVARNPELLAGGFPASMEALYGYKAVILGDIEASAFSLEQLEMLEAFVRKRGGGFMMLGGLNSFAEGDYFNTAVADMLPLTIDPGRRVVVPPEFGNPDATPAEQGFKFVPTAVGLESPILKLSSDTDANFSLWNEMPGLTSINFLGRVKPGAAILAEKTEDDFGATEPLLAVQRYGKGRSAALSTASTWRWQMHMPYEDRRHERFWRQMIRWLVASAPDPVAVDIGNVRIAPGDEVPISVDVYDSLYNPIGGATVRAYITDPFGGFQEVPLQEDLSEEGAYLAAFVPEELGVYRLDVEAETATGSLYSKPLSFLTQPSGREYRDATLKSSFLGRLADASGGAYYASSDVAAIPANLRSRRTSTSIYRSEYLWDMPVLWLLVLALLSAEWVYRRRKGLP